MPTSALPWRFEPPWMLSYAIAVLSVAAAVVADLGVDRLSDRCDRRTDSAAGSRPTFESEISKCLNTSTMIAAALFAPLP
jgi:hypothetical protein